MVGVVALRHFPMDYMVPIPSSNKATPQLLLQDCLGNVERESSQSCRPGGGLDQACSWASRNNYSGNQASGLRNYSSAKGVDAELIFLEEDFIQSISCSNAFNLQQPQVFIPSQPFEMIFLAVHVHHTLCMYTQLLCPVHTCTHTCSQSQYPLLSQ